MSPNSADSTLEKLLAWPLDIKMLVYKLVYKIFSGLPCSSRERERK